MYNIKKNLILNYKTLYITVNNTIIKKQQKGGKQLVHKIRTITRKSHDVIVYQN